MIWGIIYILGFVFTYMLLRDDYETVGYSLSCALIWPLFIFITIFMLIFGRE